MFNDANLIFMLALVTLVIVLVFGFWQISRARQAKQNHEHSAMTNHDRPSGGKL